MFGTSQPGRSLKPSDHLSSATSKAQTHPARSLVSIPVSGLTLAQKLHDYSAGVALSGKRTQEIAFHLRSTATVVEEVANIFKEEGSARRNLISQKAIETVEDVVKQCSAQFDQLNLVLDNTANGGGWGNDNESQRMLILELIVLRKLAAGRYQQNRINAQEEDEREPSGPFPSDSNRIPSETQLSAGEPATECLDKEDQKAPASIAANAKPPICNHDLDSAADSGESKITIRRHSCSIRSEQIDNTADSGGSQTEKRVRAGSLATSLEDPTIATEQAQDHARTGRDGESLELSRAWDDLVHAIDQLVLTLAVTCCCCCAKPKSQTAISPSPHGQNQYPVAHYDTRHYHYPPQYIVRDRESLEEARTRPKPRSAASGSIHLGALASQQSAMYMVPCPDEGMYLVAWYEVDELLDLWTNLNQDSSSTHDRED
ncbi:hypothetical protein CNMCM5793_005236 [Aspergillus hiratsukae]|uniref:Uncharacterized protein n=1 Tax=Aspergillus hiratsukae TaxID=1194566 RepID=A0A8H6UXQ7_9EURO|nr:hypothetical protein CNMCM5793_005236 [Aspergillus hiratsukae]KAF7171043.1 hypothetical protein CNMCM6106_005540 [Aspergillus hiratsukae]